MRKKDSALNAYAAVTDKNWFDQLRSLSRREQVDEVNFWTPKPWGGHFRVLTRGQPLLFKLKSPHNVIAGGGFFEHYTELPVGPGRGRRSGRRTVLRALTRFGGAPLISAGIVHGPRTT